MKIIHAADIHLGRRRLDGRLPDSDFALAFEYIAEQAIAGKADAFLLAGDLFDRPQVEPPNLRQAEEVLGKLKKAGLPVIAIAGNHDKAFINSEEETWLEYLADDELLVLLGTRFGPDGPIMEAWNKETRRGSWIDRGGVRFTGAGYLGAATPHKVRQIVERLETGRPNVLLLHAGPDYFVGEGGGFSADDLRIIRERVTYLALGHIHKPMLHDGWACNPGSPENCDLHESHYDLDKTAAVRPRGYAWAEIDPTLEIPLRKLEIQSNPRRPVVHLSLDCTLFGNKLKDGAVALETAACKLIAENKATSNCAVAMRLTGKINLGRIALDLQIAAQNIEKAAAVTAVALDATTINLDGIAPAGHTGDAALSREEIERASISSLVAEEHLWGLEGEEGSIARLFFELKEGVGKKKSGR
jgi:exonuclease SbcD